MPLPATLDSLVNGLEQAAARVSTASSDLPFLKLAKSGEWSYGADEIEVEENSRWAINPHSFATGFAAWGDGELLGEEMALITEEPVQKAALQHVGADWKPQCAMQLRCMDGEDEGQQVLYKTTSLGGQKAFKAVLTEVLARAKQGEQKLVPLVELLVDSYKHKTYGKVYTPTLKVVDWLPLDGAPTAQVEDKAAPAEPDEPDEPDEPKRRRRSRRSA